MPQNLYYSMIYCTSFWDTPYLENRKKESRLPSFQPYSFMVCTTTMKSRENRWKRSRTSLHETWNKLFLSNFLNTLPFNSTNWNRNGIRISLRNLVLDSFQHYIQGASYVFERLSGPLLNSNLIRQIFYLTVISLLLPKVLFVIK